MTHKKIWERNGNKFTPIKGKPFELLDAGCYDVDIDYHGNIEYNLSELKTDDILILESNTVVNESINKIKKFWASEHIFKGSGNLHKMGMVFYGIPGGGKSISVNIIISYLIENNGVIFKVNEKPATIIKCIKKFREHEPNRHLILLYEDLDGIIKKFGEEEILALVDGEDQIDHVLHLATTNKADTLSERIRRPKRFGKFIQMDLPNENVRREYFRKKFISYNTEELEKVVRKTKNFSFASMSDLVVEIKCFDRTLDEAVEIITEHMNKKIPNTETSSSKDPVGFSCYEGEEWVDRINRRIKECQDIDHDE